LETVEKRTRDLEALLAERTFFEHKLFLVTSGTGHKPQTLQIAYALDLA
jgi:hypothetical protein